jgi:hypothetical protein
MSSSAATDFFNEYAVKELFAVVVGLGLILLIAMVTVRALVRAAEFPPPATLVTALSVLTLVSIAGGITTNNDEAWAIAAAGIGALAGSVSTVYQNTRDDRINQPPPEDKPPILLQSEDDHEQT